MSSRIFVLAAALVAAMGAGAAPAASPKSNTYEICGVYSTAVDPSFCADDVDPAAISVDPFVTGGTERRAVPGGVDLDVPANPTGHADGLRVEGLRP